ncbi:hypothetical protein GALMADRAFT_1033294 [Galerina marginata CBS 339.88]|uniref:Uncharacterized protein n=1 Tax=Galerina marginata (strain CBS 339.88) TaxID=685588 RepID=A0A067SC63_GALM3|nr:hypothetical protein GALMADRAFT_1033294 [Galerina marginata CBS 339.88]
MVYPSPDITKRISDSCSTFWQQRGLSLPGFFLFAETGIYLSFIISTLSSNYTHLSLLCSLWLLLILFLQWLQLS